MKLNLQHGPPNFLWQNAVPVTVVCFMGLLAYFMEQNPCEANRFLASQEAHRLHIDK